MTGIVPFPTQLRLAGTRLSDSSFFDNEGVYVERELDGSWNNGIRGISRDTTFAYNALAALPRGNVVLGGEAYEGRGLTADQIRLSGNLLLDDLQLYYQPSATRVEWGSVETLLPGADGRVLVGGVFSDAYVTTTSGLRDRYTRLPRGALLRLNPDFTVDRDFTAGGGASATSGDWSVNALAFARDGKILVGGDFDRFAGAPRRNLVRLVEDRPAVTGPASQAVPANAPFALSVNAGADATCHWQVNGVPPIINPSGATLAFSTMFADYAGIYRVLVSTPAGAAFTPPAIIGINPTTKLTTTASEVGTDIRHPNGNVYDQVLLLSRAAALKADVGQVTRVSFIDSNDDIVQVEFSGAGALTITFDGLTDYDAPKSYNQPDVRYHKGNARLIVTGADETTHLGVFSVGRDTAVNQSLFRDHVVYDGAADLALIAILSTNGKFGGIRAGNARFAGTHGFVGLYAPGVQFNAAVIVGEITAYGAASPVLLTGGASDVRITGGDLAQPGNAAVQVNGIARLAFTAGTTSHGVGLPAQLNRARLEQDGLDVTAQIVADPSR